MEKVKIQPALHWKNLCGFLFFMKKIPTYFSFSMSLFRCSSSVGLELWTVSLYIQTRLFTSSLLCFNSIHKHTLTTRTEMQTHFFSQAKTPAVYLGQWNWKTTAQTICPLLLVLTTCLDKDTDTQSLSLFIPPFSDFPLFVLEDSLEFTIFRTRSQIWFFFCQILISFVLKATIRHMEFVNVSSFSILRCPQTSSSCHRAAMWPCNISECTDKWWNRWDENLFPQCQCWADTTCSCCICSKLQHLITI